MKRVSLTHLPTAIAAVILAMACAIAVHAQTATPTANPGPAPAGVNPYIFQNAATGNGNGNPGHVTGLGTLALIASGVSGSSATITFEAAAALPSGSTSTFQAHQCTNASTGAISTTTTVDGNFLCTVAGFDYFLATISGYGSGTITVIGQGLIFPTNSGISSSVTVSGNPAIVGATNTFNLNFTSPSSVTTSAGTPLTGLGGYRSMLVYCDCKGGTGGTLDIYLQDSPDGGTTWLDYAHFTQFAASGAETFKEFTASKASQNTTLTAIGTGTTPAIAAGTIIGGDWGDRLRTLAVTGTGTTAGAAQIIKLFMTA